MVLTRFEVEVVYATPETQHVVRIEVEQGCSLQQAIDLSGLLARLGLAAPQDLRIGVFGRLARLADLAAPGDRIEIYRELTADPKTSRRQRAAKKLRGGARPG